MIVLPEMIFFVSVIGEPKSNDAISNMTFIYFNCQQDGKINIPAKALLIYTLYMHCVSIRSVVEAFTSVTCLQFIVLIIYGAIYCAGLMLIIIYVLEKFKGI